MRAYRMETCFVARVVVKEPNRSQVASYLEIIKEYYQKKKNFPRCDFDKLQYGPSLMLYEITRHMIQTNR